MTLTASGVIYTLLFLLLIVITSTSVRGMRAALIIGGLSFITLLFAYLGWWEEILGFGGIVDKSYDTDNMILVKRQNDFFRHWVIGVGSGDLHMQTMGGRGVEETVAKVLFVIGKMSKIQGLIATKPDVPEEA